MSKTSDMHIEYDEAGFTATPPCSYESVEYSDGYYHTVFDRDGIKVRDFPTEAGAKAFVKTINSGHASKGLGVGE